MDDFRTRISKVALGFALALVCQSALAQALYRIKPLGVLGGCTASAPLANGFNQADQVTGKACNAHGDQHAFLWKNNGSPMVDLGPSEVSSSSEGDAINASGLVAGSAQDSTGTFGFVSLGSGAPSTKILDTIGGTKAFAYALNDHGQVTGEAGTAGDAVEDVFLWSSGSPMRDLGAISDHDYNIGVAINASGQIAGTSGYSFEPIAEAFVWKNDGSPLQSLGVLAGGSSSYACCINASGQIAGNSNTQAHTKTRAFIWKNNGTPMQSLGTLGGGESFAAALNDAGQVAGYSDTVRFLKPHAFVWLNDGHPMKNLGTLGGTTSFANDINASGEVTGFAYLAGDTVSHAFLWRNDGTNMQDLNTLIDSTDPLQPYITLNNGEFINVAGDIVAEGLDSRTGNYGLYVLQGTVLTVSPRSLAFGNQRVSTTSAARSVTLTNTGSRAAAITSIAVTGTASSQFHSTNNCGTSLAGHATCTIQVTFKPATRGVKSAFLNVNGGGGGLRSVSLSGNGT